MKSYQHLGPFSDLVDAAQRSRHLFPIARPGRATQQLVRETLHFSPGRDEPQSPRVERRWERDGVQGEEVSWSVGYGPRTFAYLLRPAGPNKPLPGVVALHDHGGFKYFGKEKIADGPDDGPAVIRSFRDGSYGGRAFANALAREGFAVLVPDTFLWGSRRFPREVMSGARASNPPGSPDEIAEYNSAAGGHEHTVEKYLTVLGTTLAAVISYEDRVAVAYLLGRKDVVLPGGVGCVGLSGGGLRSTLLQATCDEIRAAVVVGLMSTYEGLLDHNVVSHTWMLYPPGWSRHGDWPDLVACRAPSPLLVQYDLEDSLFTVEGMRAADRRIAEHYAFVGRPNNYAGQFYPGPHKFDREMQTAAFAWLAEHLKGART
jgi:dienelactone hydrolase